MASSNDYRTAAATKSPTPDWPLRCSWAPFTTGYSRPVWPTSTATNPAPSAQPHPPTESPSTTSHEQPDSPHEPDPIIQDTTQNSRLRLFSPLGDRRQPRDSGPPEHPQTPTRSSPACGRASQSEDSDDDACGQE